VGRILAPEAHMSVLVIQTDHDHRDSRFCLEGMAWGTRSTEGKAMMVSGHERMNV